MTSSMAAINELNTIFWAEEAHRTEARASDAAIAQIALGRMDSLLRLGFPVNHIPSFDHLLQEAEKASQVSLKHFARKGGKAPKPNALQEVIEELTREDQNIIEKDLVKKA